jgi:RNA polymerase subunit RPABC4/transcription elongation factor Spt4
VEYLFWGALIGLIPAAIARRKGRSFVAWWIFGALAFIIALPAVLLVKPVQATPVQPTPVQPTPVQPTPVQPTALQPAPADPGRACPHCAEIIRTEAKVCRFCGRSLTAAPAPPKPGPTEAAPAARFCSSCGAELPAGSEFCGMCGADV